MNKKRLKKWLKKRLKKWLKKSSKNRSKKHLKSDLNFDSFCHPFSRRFLDPHFDWFWPPFLGGVKSDQKRRSKYPPFYPPLFAPKHPKMALPSSSKRPCFKAFPTTFPYKSPIMRNDRQKLLQIAYHFRESGARQWFYVVFKIFFDFLGVLV